MKTKGTPRILAICTSESLKTLFSPNHNLIDLGPPDHPERFRFGSRCWGHLTPTTTALIWKPTS